MSGIIRLFIGLTAIFASTFTYGAENLTLLPGATGFLDYHLRLKPEKFKEAEVSLMWNVNDSECVAAVFTVPPEVDADPILGTKADYRIIHRSSQRDSILSSGNFVVRYHGGKRAGITARLRYRNGSAWLMLGGDVAQLSVAVPFNAINTGSIGYSSTRPLQELCNDVLYFETTARPNAPVNSLQELNQHSSLSDDKLECYWKYFDRDTDPALATPGGFYTLATISDGVGGYYILYIDGDKSGDTQAFAVKGRMTPTIFPNHYDLAWYDINGTSVAPECSATIELAGTMLRISIPLLKATMRFSRLDETPF